MKIVYKSENDAKEFDLDKFYKSLNRYGKVSKDQIQKALKEYEGYSVLHNSVLWEVGTKLLSETGGDARKYYSEHKQEGTNFYRLIRVTGYLTGDYRRANDAKLHEFAERTVNGKTGKNGVFSPDEKNMREAVKLAYSGIAEEMNNGKF